MDFNPSEERLIIAGCKKNESWAMKRLYEHFAPTMMVVCVRYANDLDKAKDVLHEGFIRVFNKIGSYAAKGSFEGWMRRVFVSTAIELLRKDYFRQHLDIVDYKESIENFEISIVEKLSAEDILKYVSELPEGCRTVFNLHAIEGYSHAEIAKILKIEEGSSRSQFAYARRLLQNKIKKIYYIAEKK